MSYNFLENIIITYYQLQLPKMAISNPVYPVPQAIGVRDGSLIALASAKTFLW